MEITPETWAFSIDTCALEPLVTLGSLVDYVYGNRTLLAKAWNERPDPVA